MSTTQLRKNIKRAVDKLPSERLHSLANYVEFLQRTTLLQRIAHAEGAFSARKGVNWRTVRDDV